MKTFLIIVSVLFASMLAASASAVHADLVKCVAGDGHVIITDVPCEGAAALARSEPVAELDNDGVALPKERVLVASLTPAETAAPRMVTEAPARLAAAVVKPVAYPRLSRSVSTNIDATTLRAARDRAEIDDKMRHARLVASR